ncbi:ThuA domain-containing protein [Halegenticoccus tardaugens]|uniref:ThuA domain-containing protein n=1 Tax=Halegenticoccus tardaugens TaxID=2071624 RepID=UPI00100AE1B8|nr:ThuA domain-containing protein [Halegenticoccus tardaugens]
MAQSTVLLIGENTFPFHTFDEMAPYIEAALGDGILLDTTTNRDVLSELSEYDLLIDYLTDSTLKPAQQESLLEFVKHGGGYLGIHCAADITSTSDGDGGIKKRDEPIPEFRDLLGGHFLDHPEQSPFRVLIVDDHPITDGVDDIEVFDEPYCVDYDESSIHILARMDHPDLDAYPVVWIRSYGEGSVCYASLGHTQEAFEHEHYRRLLQNAVQWLT